MVELRQRMSREYIGRFKIILKDFFWKKFDKIKWIGEGLMKLYLKWDLKLFIIRIIQEEKDFDLFLKNLNSLRAIL